MISDYIPCLTVVDFYEAIQATKADEIQAICGVPLLTSRTESMVPWNGQRPIEEATYFEDFLHFDDFPMFPHAGRLGFQEGLKVIFVCICSHAYKLAPKCGNHRDVSKGTP